jgi:hypothetical protein
VAAQSIWCIKAVVGQHVSILWMLSCLIFLTVRKAVLDAPGKLGKIIAGMNRALGEIPVTVKLRTGVKDGRNTAHKLMPRLGAEWDVGCISVRPTMMLSTCC